MSTPTGYKYLYILPAQEISETMAVFLIPHTFFSAVFYLQTNKTKQNKNLKLAIHVFDSTDKKKVYMAYSS